MVLGWIIGGGAALLAGFLGYKGFKKYREHRAEYGSGRERRLEQQLTGKLGA